VKELISNFEIQILFLNGINLQLSLSFTEAGKVVSSRPDHECFEFEIVKFEIVPGPTGFDRMREVVCKHAGSWDESLKR
jgi:hypothetical protein